MRVIVFALLTLAATSSAAPRGGVLADQIAKLFAYVKSIVPEDSDLRVTDRSWTLPENSFESGEVVINEISLSGLKDGLEYHVSEDSTQTNAQYSVSVDSLIALIDVSVDVTGLVDFQDELYIRIDLEELGFKGYLTFTDTDYDELNEFDILLGLEASEVTIKGIGSEEFDEQLSAELSAAIPEVVNLLAEAYEEPASEALKKVINDFLKS